MAQINPIVGSVKANAQKIMDIIKNNQQQHDVIVFPELALTGYSPEDLLFRHELFNEVEAALAAIYKCVENCYVIVGHPTFIDNLRYNSASVITNGQCIALYHKQHLPNYGVFDEQRYFSSGPAKPCVFSVKTYKIGLCICEDIWHPGPTEALVKAGATVMISINASPFDYTKPSLRKNLLQAHALSGLSIIYVNQTGGQDDLLFDGQSLALDSTGYISASAPAFIEHLQTIKLQGHHFQGQITPELSQDAMIYQALVCGLRDYVEKNAFPGVLLGLSGGIDSALSLCLAVDALGPSRVHAVMMPSRYSATISLEDAKQQAEALDVTYSILPIEPTFEALLTTLAPSFNGMPEDTTEENLQARIRGILLMALSNKTGKMLISTSNKSESAVGYSTLYGDMAGGFAPLKDVLKTLVYRLSKYRNTIKPVIPQRVITRAPTAELAPNQTDQDSLPDYDTLDSIITNYMERNLSAEKIIQLGYTAEDVSKIIRLIKRNEYKRRQAPPGVKITPCAFGRDWRYPLTSGFNLE